MSWFFFKILGLQSQAGKFSAGVLANLGIGRSGGNESLFELNTRSWVQSVEKSVLGR